MAKSTQELELLITAATSGIQADLNALISKVEKLERASEKTTSGGMSGFMKMASAIGAGTLAMQGLTAAFTGFLDNESALADFSALTGVTGEALGDIGDRAAELAEKFGGSAVDNIEAMKGILSRFGPDIAQTPEALGAMTEAVNTLAKASGLDATMSMDALTTAMLQFNVSLDDPVAASQEMTRMMNVMAAGAKEGAAEVPDLAEALKQAGVAAYGANLGFEETTSALEILAQGGKKGSEAGIALRNVISLMQKPSKQAAETVADLGLDMAHLGETLTKQGLNAALQELSVALNRTGSDAEKNAALARLFGMENMSAAGILLRGAVAADGQASAMDRLRQKITGTNTASEQAQVNMNTLSERFNRIGATISNIVVGAFSALRPVMEWVLDNGGPLAAIVIAGAGAYGALQLAVNASALSNVAWVASAKSMITSMVTNPVFIFAGAMMGLYQAMKENVETAQDHAQAMKAVTSAQLEENRAAQKSNEERQKQVRHSQELIDRYAELGGKANRTAKEEKDLTDAMLGINAEYPGLIKSGDSFSENLAAIQGKANALKGELAGLQGQMVGLQKQERLFKMEQFADEVDVAVADLSDAFNEVDNNIIQSFTQSVGLTKSDFNETFGAYIAAIKNASTEPELRDATMKLQNAVSAAFAGTDSARDRVKMQGIVRKMAENQKKYLASTGQIVIQEAEKVGTGVSDGLAGGGGKGKTDAGKTKIDALRGSLAWLREELSKLQEQMDKGLMGSNGEAKFLNAQAKADDLRTQIGFLEKQSKLTSEAIADIPLAGNSAEWDKLPEQVNAFTLSTEDQRSSIDKLRDSMGAYFGVFENGEQAMSSAASTFGQMIGGAFADGSDALKQGLKAIGNALIGFVEAEFFLAQAAQWVKAIFTSGGSLLADGVWSALALVALESGRAYMNSLAVGTTNVPRDQIAQIHSGEMVVPKTFAEGVRKGEVAITGGSGKRGAVFAPGQRVSGVVRVAVQDIGRALSRDNIQLSYGVA